MHTLLLTLLLTLSGFGGITSQTVIDAGKQFVLGGSQRGAFRVAAHNVGSVPVSVAERSPSGTITERGRLEPGGRATLDFGRGAAALVRNLGQQQAKLDFKIRGDVSFGMGMGYEAAKKQLAACNVWVPAPIVAAVLLPHKPVGAQSDRLRAQSKLQCA